MLSLKPFTSTQLNPSRLPLLIILAVWLALYGWRPWFFGLYHDDWILLRPLALPEIADAFRHMPTRPLLVALNILGGNLIGPNPFVWQSLMALFMLFVTLSLARFVSRFTMTIDGDRRTVCLVATTASCFWLAFPWNLGFTAFASTFTGLLGLILFFKIGEIVFSPVLGRRELLWASSLSFVLGLMFESLWGGAVLLAIIRWALEGTNTRRIRNVATSMVIALSGVQLFHIAYNRYWALLGTGQNKSFSTESFRLAASSLINLCRLLADTLLQHFVLLAALALLALLFIVAFLKLKLLSKLRILILMALCGAGIFSSLLIYALGGYSVETTGLFSRTTFGLSVWLAISAAWFVSVTARGTMPVRGLSAACVFCIFGYLTLFQINNTTPWRHSWTFQQQVLNTFPVQSFLSHAVSTGTLLIEASPPETTKVFGLHAFWDISGALYTRFPQIRTFFATPVASPPLWAIAVIANEKEFQSSYDGESLTQRWCDSAAEVWTIHAPGGLLYWHLGDSEVTPVRAPFKTGC